MMMWCRPFAALALFASLTSSAHAAEATLQDEAPPRSILSASVTLDYVNQYFFRGIVQETSGLILQPGFELEFALFESPDALEGIALTLGTWNSIHSGPSGDRQLATGVSRWYESDLYVGLAFAFAGGLTVGTTYTYYSSPNGSFGGVDELAFSLAWDDGALYGDASRFGGFQPGLTVAVELDGAAFGDREGVYGELGIEPSYALIQGGSVPLKLSLPVALGLSLSRYFEAEEEDTFGYVSAGLVATAELAFLDSRWGAWEVSAGVKGLFLGDNLGAANGKSEVLLATVGLAASY